MDLTRIIVEWLFIIFVQFTPVEEIELGRTLAFRATREEYMFIDMEFCLDERREGDQFIITGALKGLHAIEQEIFIFVEMEAVIRITDSGCHILGMRIGEDVLFDTPESEPGLLVGDKSRGMEQLVLRPDPGPDDIFVLEKTTAQVSPTLWGESIVYRYIAPGEEDAWIELTYNHGLDLIEIIHFGFPELGGGFESWVLQ